MGFIGPRSILWVATCASLTVLTGRAAATSITPSSQIAPVGTVVTTSVVAEHTIALTDVTQSRPTPVRDAALAQAVILAAAIQAPAPKSANVPDRSWAARHPVLLGTLVGLAVGVPVGAATCTYPGVEGNCSTYTYPGNARMLGALTVGGIGAGIGAALGAVIGASHR